MEKIRNFFKVDSNYQLIIINVVFAVTGSSSLFVADYLLNILLVTQENYGDFVYWLTRIILILPVYQILLIIFGFLFGEFSYFWEMEKKTLNKQSPKEQPESDIAQKMPNLGGIMRAKKNFKNSRAPTKQRMIMMNTKGT